MQRTGAWNIAQNNIMRNPQNTPNVMVQGTNGMTYNPVLALGLPNRGASLDDLFNKLDLNEPIPEAAEYDVTCPDVMALYASKVRLWHRTESMPIELARVLGPNLRPNELLYGITMDELVRRNERISELLSKDQSTWVGDEYWKKDETYKKRILAMGAEQYRKHVKSLIKTWIAAALLPKLPLLNRKKIADMFTM